jgi:aminopeptidase-like protein
VAAPDVALTGRRVCDILETFDARAAGRAAYERIEALYPICRSITGDGVRASFGELQKTVDLEIHEVPSGTPVFDWVVPPEWNIRDAYIKDVQGRRLVDFKAHNLHVLNYSTAVRQRLTLEELRPHLTSLPDHPDWIPYRTSYYRERWGFCVTQRQLEALCDAEYDVVIDSALGPGHLTYGEYRVAGASSEEVLISSHSCHPSLCNDNLSGMTVAAQVARALTGASLRYSYRFVWAPGTIGAITWLALNESRLAGIRHGLVLSCVGDPGPFTYKRSRSGDAVVDRAVEHVLQRETAGARVRDFTPVGYDERQYCSPGINLPVGCFMRTPNGEYPEYHTSADDLTLVKDEALGESVQVLLRVIDVIERNASYVNLQPKCEPQLGRRGLYSQMGGRQNAESEVALLWVLNLSDGGHDLLAIAERSGLPFRDVAWAAEALKACGLIDPA